MPSPIPPPPEHRSVVRVPAGESAGMTEVRVRRALRRAGVDPADVARFADEAAREGYTLSRLLDVCSRWVTLELS